MLGQLVCSKAGRDKGKYFIILDIIDDNYVYICDGSLRTIEKPKKKKIKHLHFTGKDVEYIREVKKSFVSFSNKQIKKSIFEALDK